MVSIAAHPADRVVGVDQERRPRRMVLGERSKASASVWNASMNECAIVPAADSPERRAASTLDVAANPTSALDRATAMAASTPSVRRNAKSTQAVVLGRQHEPGGPSTRAWCAA